MYFWTAALLPFSILDSLSASSGRSYVLTYCKLYQMYALRCISAVTNIIHYRNSSLEKFLGFYDSCEMRNELK